MAHTVDRRWWADYRKHLEASFKQDRVLIRAFDVTLRAAACVENDLMEQVPPLGIVPSSALTYVLLRSITRRRFDPGSSPSARRRLRRKRASWRQHPKSINGLSSPGLAPPIYGRGWRRISPGKNCHWFLPLAA